MNAYKSFAGSLAAITVFAAGTAAFAQSGSSASSISGAAVGAGEDGRPVPSQLCLQAMVTLDSEQLEHFDERIADEKSRMQDRIDALSAVAALADDTARAEALKAMHEGMKDMTPPEPSAEITAAMEAVKTACGDTMMFRGGPGFGMKGPGMGGDHMMMKGGRGHGPDKLLEELGMTDEEFKAALESGETIEEIAAEKGITLPARPEKGFRMKMHSGNAMFGEEAPASVEAQ